MQPEIEFLLMYGEVLILVAAINEH